MSTLYTNYNPDILETIANLSNDEVFTPPKLANEILDLLPEEVWSNPNLTFLDPAVKTGIFLREITRRLIDGLADQIPDLQERVNHILTKQVFGIGITELTTLMARRTVYCSMYANGEFSICTEFDDEKGNIIFPNTEHTWDKNGRCEFCGANEENYGGGAGRESYAYPFIHDNFEKEFGNMKFDVIIGNPPYQLETSGAGAQATPIYDKFISKAKELKPDYISMIIPSRWMNGGMGLNNFREEMINDTKIKYLVDYENSQELFPSVRVDGGICYFLWDDKHNGKVRYTYNTKEGEQYISERFLKVGFLNHVIRNSKHLSIIEKTYPTTKKFEDIVSPRNQYGFGTNLFNATEQYENVKLANDKKEGYNLIYGLEKNKRVSKYINRESIVKNEENIDKYKIFFPSAMGTETTLLPKVIIGNPGSISTGTFMEIGPFNTKDEMLSCLSYMKTKFFRALFNFNKYAFFFTRRTFELIPLQDWNKTWTDEELYKKYKLTQEEIDYIEENIDPMPTDK